MDRNNVNISKEPWLAVVLSTFLAGVGQIYSRRILRGCALIFIQLAIAFSAVWFIFSITGNIKIGAYLLLVHVIIHIWNLFDAYKCAKKANTEDFEISRKENKDPWLAVFLSDLLPGLGQMYIKKRVLGIIFIACLVALLIGRETYPLHFIGLWAILSASVCCHAYISSPVRRESSKKLIAIITIAIFCRGLLGYTAVLWKKYFVEAFKVTTGSMEPTLIAGDRALVRKSGRYTPERGDVIVFKCPTARSIPWVKRVVALGGESVEMKGHYIYINGNKLECPPFQNIDFVPMLKFGAEGKPFRVPDDSVFVLGDNSGRSQDSRYFGAIPKSDLIGRAYKIYWPLRRIGPIE
jgi:signal peptidase I